MFKDDGAEKKMFNLVERPCFVNRRCDKMRAKKGMRSSGALYGALTDGFKQINNRFDDFRGIWGRFIQLVERPPKRHQPLYPW